MDNLQIVKLTAENFKRLKAVSIEPGSNVIKVSGRNEAGKSSTLDAIWAALGGKDASPEKPIRDGEKTATVTLDLGDIIVTRKWTEKGNYLALTDAEGAPFASPQKVLDRLYGKFTFDPAAFLGEKDQRAALLQVVDLAPDWQAFKTASGMAAADPADIKDPLRYISDVRKTVYDRRRDLNRDAKAAESRVAAAREQVPPGLEAFELPDMDTLLETRRRAQGIHDEYQRAIAATSAMRDNLTQMGREIGTLEEQIETLSNQLAKKRELTEAASAELSSAVETNKVIADSLPDLDAIDAQIADANKLAAASAAVTNLKNAEKEHEDAARKAADVDNRLSAIDTFVEGLLNNVQMPVDGLGITDDGITLDGIPFSQCSHAQRLKTSIAIGMAANPKLRILRVSDGEKFDSASWAIIEEMAAEKRFQIWVEQMDESGAVGVFIEDGEVKADNYAKS